jgi:hypothetical protein
MELLSQVLRALCHGHVTEMQHYVREQPDNYRSVDLIVLSVNVLQVLVERIDHGNISTVIQV